VPYLRVLAELSRDAARTFDPLILAVDPTHPVARRNHYVSGLLRGDTDFSQTTHLDRWDADPRIRV